MTKNYRISLLTLDKWMKKLSARVLMGPYDKLLLAYCFSGNIKQRTSFFASVIEFGKKGAFSEAETNWTK